MAKEFRAKFSKGKLEPLEDIDLEEGEEIIVSVKERVFSEERLKELQRYGEQKAKEAGITSEEEINELIYDQRHRDK